MTQPIAMLDADELTSWLMRLSQTVDRSLREPTRAAAMTSLRDGLDAHDKVGLPVLIQLAFLSDCLHVAHLAIGADGVIEADELERVADLMRLAASKYFFALPAYEAFDEDATSIDDVARFLRVHRDDTGPFGFKRSEEWRGLALARLVEHATRNAAPLRDHERMLSRIMEAVFAGRTTEVEQLARRRLRDLFERPAATGVDPRAVAFCRSDGPEVFSSVAHGSHFHERDPFDIDTIHAEARARFHREVDRKTTPEHAHGQGSMLLVLGGAGAGKTHVLRAMRNQVHARRQGYVGYLQLTPDIDDYTRYVLRSLIDSLERPYDAPELTESSLMYLSDGLVEGRVAISPDDLERLRTADLTSPQLEQLVGKLVDHVVRGEGLGMLETDLIHALLLLQRRDPAIHRRVVRFLRSEPLGAYDREVLAGLAARDKAEDPLRTIRQLAAIMHELQLAAMVIVVDQIEDVIPDGTQVARLQQALDAIRAIADAVPSAVVVLSCLDDVYDQVKPRLGQSLRDRLDRNEILLTTRRQPDEIEQMLVRRLEHLYSFFDVAWRDDDPLYPFTPAQLDAISHDRIRDCLSVFRAYHTQCIAARAIVARTPAPPSDPVPDIRTTSPGIGAVGKPPGPIVDLDALDRQWRDEIVRAKPPEDAAVLTLISDTLRGAAAELGRDIAVRPSGDTGVVVEGARVPRKLIAICNNALQRGSFTSQLKALRAAAVKAAATPAALRNGETKFQPKTQTAQYVGEMIAAGGLLIALTEEQLRTAVAARAMSAVHPEGFAVWQRARKHLTELPFIRYLLELDREHEDAAAAAPVINDEPAPGDTVRIDVADVAREASPPQPAPEPAPAPPPATSHAIRLGVTDSLRADPILLELEDLKTHVAFLGSTGSGKTTAALCVAEQLLERGVSVLMIDRKGDLARYVDEAWWRDPAPEAARRRALRPRIELAMFTPGNPQGRPLRLPLVPALADVKKQDREQLAGYAADGLAAMMGYGKSQVHKHKHSVLKCAIALLHEARDVTLKDLLEVIDRPDPVLLDNVRSLQRHFVGLSEDLQSLLIQRGSLLEGDGEPLDVAALLPPHGGKPRLSIINTSALTEVAVLQFWISRLLVEISRLGRKRPSATLQAAAFFDEADTYIPAMREPPTKEPMFDLLRRSRSTGIGVLLATQNPGDLDYKARDNINTWLLGKIAQDTAIAKMRNLIGPYPDVGPRLASQATGHFFLLTATTKRELRADRSLMATQQLSEAEVAELARASRA